MHVKKHTPGSPKGQPKPAKRALDPGFPGRLGDAFALNPGLTVPLLARKIKCTRAVLHNYLNGKNRTVEALLLFELADALSVSARWLLKAEGAMAKIEALTPDQLRVLQTFSQLGNEEARDLWIGLGEEIRRKQPSLLATAADPYNGKHAPSVVRQTAPIYRKEKHK